MDNSKKRSPWRIANDTVLLLHLAFPVWLVAWMYTPAISSILLPVMMICGLLPGVCSKLVKKFQKGKGLLIASRVLAVFAIAAFYTPLVVLRSAKEVQLLYPLKRFLYTYGVYGDGRSGIYEALLPEQLPDACTGYRFRTQGSLIAQDYHASSYLTFYTDAATLDTYAAYYDSMDCERIQYAPVGETDEEQFPHLSWFCGQMKLDQTMSEHSEQMTLYWFDSYYPMGVLLDYDTGLVAVLT